MTTRGWGPWRQVWHSLCSAHVWHERSCLQCSMGGWHFALVARIEQWLFRASPALWVRWAELRNRLAQGKSK